jgi:hypothetical protein
MSISKEASAALMDLLKFVSKSEYLLSQKESNQDLFFLLDSISYLICYHYHVNILKALDVLEQYRIMQRNSKF